MSENQSTTSETTDKKELLEEEEEDGRSNKGVSEYYQKQNEMLENFKNDSEQIEAFNRMKSRKNEENSVKTQDSLINRHQDNLKEEEKLNKAAKRLANITLGVNFTLMIAKIMASVLSGSMSIISSMVDSVVDLTSGLILSISNRMIRKRDPYLYPRGRTRLEPLALILISVIMGMASVQLIISSANRISDKLNNIADPLDVTYITVGIMLTTVCTKFLLFMICQKYKSNPSIKVLAMDHRNDCISNLMTLGCAWMGKNYWYYMDPIGAILVSFYILYTWIRTGRTHALMLSGKSAAPEFINRIIKVGIDHDKRITHIDTVYVYHFGLKFLVEMHIVLDQKMPLKEAHDIAESLQTNIESLPEVERAFVHTDYDFTHHPHDEHKNV
ncbi:unnamed protein product [Caenorhabditis angaria]|uniref:Cation efflux protein cytoplasmic domain-containing protein n=1 Tax=Caenorhabditis angaria TaxID=860376 RepID=A0A9P1IHT6_9PELO|nr:unnamed protein product [Caenorhabditis angaria]